MKYVKRANVVLEVKDDTVPYYLNLGYDVIDDTGKVIQKSIPQDLGSLRKFYIEANAKIEKLEARIAELEAKTVNAEAPKSRSRKKQEA